jgi:hypothetical protein
VRAKVLAEERFFWIEKYDLQRERLPPVEMPSPDPLLLQVHERACRLDGDRFKTSGWSEWTGKLDDLYAARNRVTQEKARLQRKRERELRAESEGW